MKNRTFFSVFFSVIFCNLFAQKGTLEKDLNDFIKPYKAKVGIAILNLENGQKVLINNEQKYPMQSVYKYHLAFAVMHEIDKGKLKLDQKILIKKEDLLPDTHSPLRDKYPKGNVQVPLSELLSYTVSESDNNGCDILFKLLGGPKKVHSYIKSLGIKDVSIVAMEQEVAIKPNLQFENSSTPLATLQLLQRMNEGKSLSKTSNDFLWKIMYETTTGPKRLKGLLPQGTPLAHKTGSSGTSKNGTIMATNDIGIITTPNGQKFAIVVFVMDSKEKNEVNEQIIARIAQIAFRAYQ